MFFFFFPLSGKPFVCLIVHRMTRDDLDLTYRFSAEMAKVASELRAGIGSLKARRMKAVESGEVERLKNNGKEFPATTSGN